MRLKQAQDRADLLNRRLITVNQHLGSVLILRC